MTAVNAELGGLATNVVLSSAYDAAGDRVGLSANIGGTLGASGAVSGGTPDFLNSYSYDSTGDMTGITQTGQTGGNGVAPKNVTLAYNYNGLVTGIDAYASTGTADQVYASTYSYDDDSRLTDLTYTNAQDSLIAGYHWDYDADSRVSDMYSRNDTTGTPGGGYTGWAETSYSYDHDSQLTTTSYNSNFANPPTTSTSETYDPNGNRANTGDVVSYGNRMLFDGTYYYTYDQDGNRTAKYESTTGALDSTATSITIYQWNNANELTGVSQYASYYNYQHGIPVSGSQVAYGYDAYGQMVSESPVGGTAEYFINDGQNPVLVLNSGGQVLERELWSPLSSGEGQGEGSLSGAAVDQILATEKVTPLSPGSVQSAGTVNWDLTDNQGTVRDVAEYNASTQTTSVVDHLVYASYGQIASQTNSTYRPTFTYTGMWQDPTTGLDYDDARWYDSVDGIFASQDPVGFGGGQTNLSEYCGNSPTNATDPSGMAIVKPTSTVIDGRRPTPVWPRLGR